MNEATSEEAAGQMATSVESGASGFRRTNAPAPSGFAVVTSDGEGEFLPPECLHVADGETWTDADGDGYPSPAVHVDIACSLPQVVASGRITFEDTTPAVAGFDSSYSFDDLDVLVTGTANRFHIAGHSAESNAGQAIGAGAFELTRHEDQTTNTQFVGPAGDDTVYGEIDEDYVWDLVLTATGFQPGNDAPAGSLVVDGAYDVHVQNYAEDIEQRSSMSVTTTTPLGLDPACATNIVSGSVTATFAGDDGDAEIIVSWTGCGTHTSSFVANAGGG